ncbi:AAA family ATPase [Saccharothrix sp. AJ9571]|nr:AAA family ATPase [Saccharothrix sp. AJ9571]
MPVPPIAQSMVPAERNSFIGRAGLLEQGMRLVSTARLVTLIGTGGVGKTRLLLRLAHKLTETSTFKHGVVVVRLTDIKEDDDRLESTITEALGIGDNSATPGLARLIEHLRHKHILLALDSCEHLIGPSAGSGPVSQLLNRLLTSAPSLHVVTTSRVRLGIQGENTLKVEPMCTGLDEQVVPRSRPRSGGDRDARQQHAARPQRPCDCQGEGHEARRLLLDRAAEISVHLAEQDHLLADRLCKQLAGIPLAIELAARRLDTMTLQEVVDYYRKNRRPLRLLVDGDSEQRHHRTMRAALDWSYKRLPEAERQVLAAISVFDGGFDIEGAQAICHSRSIEDSEVHELLSGLVRKSLLVADEHAGRTRYRMLNPIRHYGQELVEAAGEEAALRQAHAEYFDKLAARCTREWFGPAEIEWMHRLRAEVPNLRAAQEFFLADPASGERGLELAIRLSRTRFFVFSGLLNEARRMLALGLDGRADTPTAQQVAGLSMAAWVALIQGNQESAEPLMAQAEEIACELGISDSFGPLLYSRATQLWLTEPDQAKAREAGTLFARAERAFQDHGTDGDTFMVILFDGMMSGFHGDRDTAFAAAQRVLRTARAAGAQWCISWALWNYALAELQFGDPGEAGRLAQEGLRIQQATGETWGRIWSEWLLAIIAAKLGLYELVLCP